jgi:alkylation response protein AidB-like acyl-CoA dehydrogenase
MDLTQSPAEEAFRYRAREWLAANKPATPRPTDPAESGAFDRAWQRKLFDGGFAGINWPKEYGGAGLDLFQQVIWYEEIARAHAPWLNSLSITINHAGPTLIQRGSEAQKAKHLEKMLSGEEVWCQGFSEPGAGSDLAALQTRGEVVGDEIIVNGQKMWTSYGHVSDFQELLIRTDPGSKRHHGLTWVICDMKSPGIRITPVVNMMGEQHVNMVFYDDVRIPLENVVGGVSNGWSVAMSTLSIERIMSFLSDQIELLEKVDRVFALATETRLDTGRLASEDDEIMRRLARVKADALAIRAMTLGNLSRLAKGGQVGPEGSMMKLYVTTTYKRLSGIVAEILGPEFIEYGHDRNSNQWTYEFMWAWVLTISGGSSEIQREVIADRLLELPRAR